MRWALLPILWAALLLPSSNVGWFDGLPLDTGPELIGLLLLLPLTVSRALRRHWRRLIGAWGPIVPTVLLALGLLAVGGKLALLASGTYEGFLGCYRYALAPPPTGPCERSFANPWFRYSVTRDRSRHRLRSRDVEPGLPQLEPLRLLQDAQVRIHPCGSGSRSRSRGEASSSDRPRGWRA